MSGDVLREYEAKLQGWSVVDGHHLHKHYAFPDFLGALKFTNLVGELAETVGHHPDCLVGWGKVEITIWTHAIGGLHIADFILAAQIDRIRRT